jgi:hypothetical protein
MSDVPLDLEAIKARLVRAGYPRPVAAEPAQHAIRPVTREARQARLELREHIIEDIWALIGALEARRQDAV